MRNIPESLRLSDADFSINLLATPEAYLVPNVVAFGSTEREIRCMGYNYSSFQLCPGLGPGEDTPASPHIKITNAGKLRLSIQLLQKRGHEEYIRKYSRQLVFLACGY